MTRCARCRRLVLNPVLLGGMPFGRVCAAAMGVVAKPKRAKLFTVRMPKADTRQADLFAEGRA